MSTTNTSVFLLNDGTVRTVGYNQYGQCGTGSATGSPYAYPTLYNPGLSNVKQVSCGSNHIAYLLNDDTVRMIGNNLNGQCGTGNTATPQLTLYNPGLTDVRQVICGGTHTVFLLKDGTVRTVGANSYGQCGTGNTSASQLTLYNPGLVNVKQVACGGSYTVFLMNDGTIKTVGRNDHGECGIGNNVSPQLAISTIPNLTDVKQVTCGAYHTIFVMYDGTIKTVGYNTYGQCGTGNTTTPQLSIYTIPGMNNVVQAYGGYGHTVILMQDGTVQTFGLNSNYQCGNSGSTTPQLTPYTIPSLANVQQVTCGYYYTLFLLNDGKVKSVGDNSYGQCGTGSTAPTNQTTLYTISSLSSITKSLYEQYIVTIIKYLIRYGVTYYSIKSNYYDSISHQYTPLSISGRPNTSDILLYGFDSINSLLKQITVGSDTFIPMDKLFADFNIEQYVSKA